MRVAESEGGGGAAATSRAGWRRPQPADAKEDDGYFGAEKPQLPDRRLPGISHSGRGGRHSARKANASKMRGTS